MTEICHEERVALRELIELLPQLRMLVDPLSPQPAPVKPQTLIEAVERYLLWLGDNTKDMRQFRKIERELKAALAAEKRRNQLIASLILVAKSHRNKADNLDRAIAALDAFEKEQG